MSVEDDGDRDRETADYNATSAFDLDAPPPAAIAVAAASDVDSQTFLRSPCPRDAGIVQCYIRRNKTGPSKLFPEYSLFMKASVKLILFYYNVFVVYYYCTS